MTKSSLKSRLQPIKHKPKIKQEVSNNKSYLPPNPQTIKQKLFIRKWLC